MTVLNNFFTKIIRSVFFLFFSLIVLSACEGIEQDVAEMEDDIEKINKRCPVLIDSETQLDGIQLLDNNIIKYNYTLINVFVTNLDTHQFNLAMWPGILSTIRVSPEMQKFRDNKMSIQYFYRDRNHTPVYTFKVSPTDYLKDSIQ